ncbi:hypothetical protein IFU40_06085 [Microbacterium sp. CFBP 13617]|uniref:phage tail tube protein n=1 Tax=Microbacterium sp. CFBP 13617 TaxID=2774035 RepID=UPI001782DC60|nr:hypothetical protein [Microbacterium sp. CFBP 13617]MBD8218201.1 hypothetical protein [Microbacterium sp. CFBP 13617]
MAVNADLARIYGSYSDAVNLAPLGTTLPTTIDGVLDAAFDDVGWLHSDGITEALSGSVEKKRGHQGNGIIRTRMNESGTSISFIGLETKSKILNLRYKETAVSITSDVRKATRSAGQRIAVRSAVIDLFDADDESAKERLIIPRFEIAPNGDRTFASSDIAGFPFIGEIIGSYTHLMKVAAA